MSKQIQIRSDCEHKCKQELSETTKVVGVQLPVIHFGTDREYILCAAIWLQNKKQYELQPKNIESGIVVCGRRHHNCFITLLQFLPKRTKDDKIIQGFITNKDRFVNRDEAEDIARKAGQITKPILEHKGLLSEDLY